MAGAERVAAGMSARAGPSWLGVRPRGLGYTLVARASPSRHNNKPKSGCGGGKSAAGVVAGAIFTCDEEHFSGVNSATACARRGRDMSREWRGQQKSLFCMVPKRVVTILDRYGYMQTAFF